MEATQKDDGIKVVIGGFPTIEIPPEPESTEPVTTEPEPAPVVGTEVETTEPEPISTEVVPTGTEIEPTGTEVVEATGTGTGAEPAAKTDEVPKILGEIKDQMKKLDSRYGYLQRRVDTLGQEPAKPAEPEKPKPSEKPRPKEEDFETYDLFIDALTDWKVDAKIEAQSKVAQEKEQDGRTAEAEKEFKSKLDEAKERYTDFEEVAMNENNPITHAMVEILHETENPGDIAYYLGQNPKECRTIGNMTPFQAAKAIGKIEAEIKVELEKNPPATPPQKKESEKKVTSAPTPINTIKSREVVTKDPSKMTQPEYEAWRRGE
jgi:hypothetical protein